MKKYRFRLETVLREREMREDERKRETALALKHLQHEQWCLEALLTRKRELLLELEAEKARRSPDIARIRWEWSFLCKIDRDLMEQALRIQKAKDRVLEARSRLAEAVKRKKVLQTLHRRDFKRYLWDLDREEQKTMDEFSILRAAHEKLG
jgi:flagellar export protein FliJ